MARQDCQDVSSIVGGSEHSFWHWTKKFSLNIEVGSCQTCLCMHVLSAPITAELDLVHRSVGTRDAQHAHYAVCLSLLYPINILMQIPNNASHARYCGQAR